MKELKVQTEALAHPQAPIAVESGEGIERGKSWFPSPISGGGVESGEGIESSEPAAPAAPRGLSCGIR